ncbi:MAG TPA: carboxypeptidase regulatory-like domain-containing protein [Thermoanaerobaculia bacterium]|nr:carboxypeptidase regulatory-like domain-containing protein [Thermoanaerobaculia bacterium]
MKSANLALAAFAVWGLHANAAALLTIRDAATAAPVPGATIVLAQEGVPGPYPAITSNASGAFELPAGASEVLVIHPSYLPQKVRLSASTSEVVLEPGQSVKSPGTGSSSLRVYLASWIGHYDVEALPPISTAGELRCGGDDVVFDVASADAPRAISRGSLPSLRRAGAMTTITVRVRQGKGGVVYLAPSSAHPADPMVARSRLLDDRGVATLDGVALQDHVAIIAAPEGYAPTLVKGSVTSGKQFEIVPLPSLTASAHVQCAARMAGISAHATFALRQMPSLEIDRDASVNEKGNIRVSDGGDGTVKIVVSAPGRRDVTRAILLSPERPAADAGGICPGLPFSVRGSVAGDNGRPLRGALIRYGDSSVTSSTTGDFHFTAAAPDAGTLSVTAPGYLRWQRWFEPSDVPTALAVRLTKGVLYQVRVTDSRSGAGVSTYTLRCYSAGDGERLALSRTVSSKDGRYTTPPLPDDLFQVVVEAEGFEMRGREVTSRMRVRDGARTCDLGTVELKPKCRLAGRVLDDASRAVKGAVIRLRGAQVPEWDAGTAGFNLFETRTRADGTFDIAAASGTYALVASADGFAPTERSVTFDDAFDLGDIQLREGLSALARVVSHANAPSAGVDVELHRGDADDKRDVRRAITDDDGKVAFRHLSPGAYTLVARRDHRLATKTIAIDDSSDPETDLEIGSTIVQGFATDGGRPLRDTDLALLPAETLASPGVTVIRQQIEPSGRTRTVEVTGKAAAASVTRTDSTGFFTFSDVAAGRYVLTVQDGTGSRSRSITIPDAESADGSTDFGGTPIEGIVTDSQSGTPMAAAVVLLENATNETLASTLSDGGGRFEFVNAGEGAIIQASHDGYKTGSASVSDRGDLVTVALQRGTLAFRGIVRHRGVTQSGVVVAWQSDGQGPMRGGNVTTATDGTFQIDDLAPGDLMLGIASPQFGIEFRRIHLTDGESNEAVVELEPGSQLHLQLPRTIAPQQVAFQVFGGDVTQMLWRLPNGAPSLTAESEWTWSSLAPATYQIVAGGQGRTLVLSAGEDARLSFGSPSR